MFLKKNKNINKNATGDGPVDAVYKAISQLTKTKAQLVDYIIQAISGGTDAQGDVTVRITDGKNTYSGKGADTDIIVASAKAYLAAINRSLVSKRAVQ